jgi:hypothetical protein
MAGPARLTSSRLISGELAVEQTLKVDPPNFLRIHSLRIPASTRIAAFPQTTSTLASWKSMSMQGKDLDSEEPRYIPYAYRVLLEKLG